MENFTKINETLRKSLKLNDGEKIFISYIIGFQENNIICYQSNYTLGNELGKSEGAIRKIIVKLNKYDWFTTNKKYDGNKTSTHYLSIDIQLLYQFLGGKIETTEKREIGTYLESNDEPYQSETKKETNQPSKQNNINYLMKELYRLSNLYEFPLIEQDNLTRKIENGEIESKEDLMEVINNNYALRKLMKDEEIEEKIIIKNNKD